MIHQSTESKEKKIKIGSKSNLEMIGQMYGNVRLLAVDDGVMPAITVGVHVCYICIHLVYMLVSVRSPKFLKSGHKT